jgi:hypothetical protein
LSRRFLLISFAIRSKAFLQWFDCSDSSSISYVVPPSAPVSPMFQTSETNACSWLNCEWVVGDCCYTTPVLSLDLMLICFPFLWPIFSKILFILILYSITFHKTIITLKFDIKMFRKPHCYFCSRAQSKPSWWYHRDPMLS